VKWGTVRDASSGRLLLEKVGITERVGERMRGLLSRPPLSEGEGLWIVPCSSVHTVGMGYPLDLVYLDRRGTVLKIVRRLRPWRFSACLGASVSLEIRAGAAEKIGLARGLRLVWEARPEGEAG
jgi:uncharacterized membrane protein (UPF0127 family)